MLEVVFVYPIIRTDFIDRSIETLFKYTDKKKFRVIVVDQSMDGWKSPQADQVVRHGGFIIRSQNMGFSSASNKGITLALKMGVPYISVVNDDTEFMYATWFEDALEEFKTDPKIVAICPESPRIAGWGYGLAPDEYIELIAHREQFSLADIDYLKSGNYNKVELQSRHEFTIPDSFPITKRGVIDGIAMWMPIFKREAFIQLGLFEERFVWGGGEDYDLLGRAYSCGYPIPKDVCGGEGDPQHLRMVSTMKSWVWHWWGKSKDEKPELDQRLFESKEPWNDLSALWGDHFDVWGHWDDNGIRRPIKRILPVKADLL